MLLSIISLYINHGSQRKVNVEDLFIRYEDDLVDTQAVYVI